MRLDRGVTSAIVGVASCKSVASRKAMNILLVEDDLEVAAVVTDGFQEQGYTVDHVVDGSAALEMAVDGKYQLVVLDRMLPSLDGLSLVRRLRAQGVTTPVIFLTTMSGIDDRVTGLEAGADDYLVKPFAFMELLARARVLARRPAGGPDPVVRLRTGSVDMDLLKRVVWRGGRNVELLPQEFRLLEYLLRNADRVVTRKMLLESVWDIHFDPQSTVVESHISRLRSKLNQGGQPDVIQTVRGMGYRLLAH